MTDEKERLKKESEEFDSWLEKQKGNTDTIIVRKGNATKEEWVELLDYLEKKMWDYDEND